jgi:hypothetical protein
MMGVLSHAVRVNLPGDPSPQAQASGYSGTRARYCFSMVWGLSFWMWALLSSRFDLARLEKLGPSDLFVSTVKSKSGAEGGGRPGNEIARTFVWHGD